MPLTGTLDISSVEASAPLVEDLGTEPWRVEGAGIMQALFEIDDSAMTSLLPPALHPTIPPTMFINAMKVSDSEVGPFTLAEVRIGCRAATRPRGYLARAYCDSDAAVERLRNGWGYPVEKADVSLLKTYYSAVVSVVLNGESILNAGMQSPEPIGGGDVQYLANMNLARVHRDGAVVPRLIQVDPEYTFHSADRGLPMLVDFDADAWQLSGAVPVYPVSASYALCDVTFPQLRYMANPALPPLQSIERI